MLIAGLLFGWIAAVVLAVRNVPRVPEARRRLRGLWLLALPVVLMVVTGPFVIDHHALGSEGQALMTFGQYGAGAILLAAIAGGIAFARGARLSALGIGLAVLIPAFVLFSASILIIDPGS